MSTTISLYNKTHILTSQSSFSNHLIVEFISEVSLVGERTLQFESNYFNTLVKVLFLSIRQSMICWSTNSALGFIFSRITFDNNRFYILTVLSISSLTS